MQVWRHLVVQHRLQYWVRVLNTCPFQERNLSLRFHAAKMIDYNCGEILHSWSGWLVLMTLCQSYGVHARGDCEYKRSHLELSYKFSFLVVFISQFSFIIPSAIWEVPQILLQQNTHSSHCHHPHASHLKWYFFWLQASIRSPPPEQKLLCDFG